MKTIRVLLVLMFLSFGFGADSFVTAALQNTGSRTANVEIIVDASGSMAAETNTGELRIDSAKRVLTEVINAIPEAEGVNVGLRVYGHLGDNTDEGRPESCVSSDLLVPVDGVNKPELLEQVGTLQPVGWTPIGYALEQASDDFTQPASVDVVNAIVMVTDGLETCDAEPAAIAGDLRSSEAGITTHVIGFGTTPEEQSILSSIAEAGEGQLLGSDNTGQLLSALFEVLEELNVVEETGTGESRDSPLGIGRIGRVGDFELSVISVTPNADDIVATENEFNELPAEGNQFLLVTISATYVGATSGNPSVDLDYQAVGASSSSYTTYNNTCGVIPSDLYSVTDQFPGGTAEFNICWQVESADEDSLVMYVEAFLDFNSSPVWFSLGNPIEETVDSESRPAPTVQASEVPVPTTVVSEPERGSSSTREDSSRENPLAVGEVGVVDDYEISVLSVTPNADDIVTADAISEPPTPGNQYFLVNISVTYVGETTGEPPFDLNPQAVGALSTSYTTFNNQCGFGTFEGNYILATELFEGGTAEYNVCWQIDSEDADSLVMYVESNVDFDLESVWFELQP